jgi:hypothetical protein
MRKSIWKHAIECGSVDAVFAQTDRGARVMMQPILRISAIRPATYALSVAEAKPWQVSFRDLWHQQKSKSRRRCERIEIAPRVPSRIGVGWSFLTGRARVHYLAAVPEMREEKQLPSRYPWLREEIGNHLRMRGENRARRHSRPPVRDEGTPQ